MSMSENEGIVKFILGLSERYPKYTIIDNPTKKIVRIEDEDGKFYMSYSYPYILEIYNTFR